MEKESLNNSFRNILEEARLVFPGTQTLFGFQLIVVFTEFFQTQLGQSEKLIHFTSIAFTVISFAIILTVTAYHRHIHYDLITKELVILANKLLKLGMIPLSLAIVTDFYIVCLLIFSNELLAILSTATCLMFLVVLWFILPKTKFVETLR